MAEKSKSKQDFVLVGATVIAGRAQRHKEEPLSAFPERRGGGVKSKGEGGGGMEQVLPRTDYNDMQRKQ